MRNVPSLHAVPSQTEVDPEQVQYPSTNTQKVDLQFLDLKKLGAKRLAVLCIINKENFSLPLIITKRLRGIFLSVLGLEMMRRTIFMCRCRFDICRCEIFS